MSPVYAVNLLPEACHNARRRAVRRNGWTVVGLTAGLLVVGAWIALGATNHVILGLHRQLVAEEAKHAELDRQLMVATTHRDQLVKRAQALAALRQQHYDCPRIPEQLLALARLAPDGVVFTDISGTRTSRNAEGPAPSARPRSATPVTGSPAAEPAKAARARPGAEPLSVRLSGYALDHQQLARLIEALRQVPQWEEPELLRAAREPYHRSEALAFRIECRQTGQTEEISAATTEAKP
jgi:hypothetical protein